MYISDLTRNREDVQMAKLSENDESSLSGAGLGHTRHTSQNIDD